MSDQVWLIGFLTCKNQFQFLQTTHYKGSKNSVRWTYNTTAWWSENYYEKKVRPKFFQNLFLESVHILKFCNMSLILARYRFEYLASRASPKQLARHWSLGPSLEMSPKFGKLASTSPCKWSIFKLIHYFFPFPCFIYRHLLQ